MCLSYTYDMIPIMTEHAEDHLPVSERLGTISLRCTGAIVTLK